MDRVRAFWASVRPRSRRGALLGTAAILGGAAALSVGLFVAVAMAWNPYLTYDLDRQADARTWAAYELTFAGTGTCAECHEPDVATISAKPHTGVACESCHGPSAAHVEERPSPGHAVVRLEEPRGEDCLRCHVDAAGRPASFPVVDPWQHYSSACLECHDAHTATAVRPPEVMHPLANLPYCIVCHGPEGFKARNIRHPDEDEDDVSCMECHAKGRGPAEDETR
jgi:hypothetical protein